MNTTGIFQDFYYDLGTMRNGQSFPLVLVGDIHWGTSMLSDEAWKTFKLWGQHHPEARYIGMGDYIDAGSASERLALHKLNSDLHEQTAERVFTIGEGLTVEFCKEVSFMKGRTIGLLEGNHFLPDRQGMTMTQRICDYLECDYLGVCALGRISAKRYGSVNSRSFGPAASLDICLHHGRGASRKPGGSINTVEDLRASFSADLFAMGHDHQRGAYEKSQIYLPVGIGKERGTVRSRKQLLVRTGSFLRGYVKGRASYIADVAYPPSGLGVATVEITLVRTEKDGKERLYLDMEARI